MTILDGNGALAIVTSYQFQYFGDIIAWLAYVEPNGSLHSNGRFSSNFQVWRPSPTVSDNGAGEYSLVGENRFINISFDANDPISETPAPSDVISVRPGDVEGFFQSSIIRNDDLGIQLNRNFTYDRQVWYQTSFTGGTPSTLVVGSGGELSSTTNAGVVLSVDICELSN